MSVVFYGYRFPKARLWEILDTLRPYVAATHRYATVAMALAITHGRQLRRLGVNGHSDLCKTRYLGMCSCNFWHYRDLLKNFVSDKRDDLQGLEVQLVDYGDEYLMKVTGDYTGFSCWPAQLSELLGIRDLVYDDRSDVPPEEEANGEPVHYFYKMVDTSRYLMAPLLTLDDLDKMMWWLTAHLGKAAILQPHMAES